ncbi:MAG: hypothetical protein IPK16_29730 [Anaerolineales bacterium]|nr:hypothetical protein [Anaerolineales bacterium]
MTTTTVGAADPAGAAPEPRKKSRMNRFDNPWLNWKFIVGLLMVASIPLLGIIGQFFWDPTWLTRHHRR